MQMPLQITSRQIEVTSAIENTIRDKIGKLDRYHDSIIGCRVTIDTPHRHKHKGRMHNLSIDVTIPGKEIVVKHEGNEDLYVSIRDAYEAAKRQLIEYAAKQRAEQKSRAPMPELATEVE
ncbi:MAG: ribosome-associated translation inhibitor RaiA [Gammaproteobacteria bacterium]|nr:ribosome-associated translation inhibitor RaiA [Gammaproteobacteria bacterium]